MRHIWVIGDNFTARSFRTHFKRDDAFRHYMKQFFEVTPFCNSRFSSSNTNMIARLQNTLATGFNKSKDKVLPSYIVVVLDDDLITYLDFKHEGAATLLGTWVEWLVAAFAELLESRLQQLTDKSKDQKQPVFFYWVTAPLHHQFSKERNNLRVKFNSAWKRLFVSMR